MNTFQNTAQIGFNPTRASFQSATGQYVFDRYIGHFEADIIKETCILSDEDLQQACNASYEEHLTNPDSNDDAEFEALQSVLIIRMLHSFEKDILPYIEDFSWDDPEVMTAMYKHRGCLECLPIHSSLLFFELRHKANHHDGDEQTFADYYKILHTSCKNIFQKYENIDPDQLNHLEHILCDMQELEVKLLQASMALSQYHSSQPHGPYPYQ